MLVVVVVGGVEGCGSGVGCWWRGVVRVVGVGNGIGVLVVVGSAGGRCISRLH